MTFCVMDVQRLIVAAGGDVKPGTPIKTYFWKLSQILSVPGDPINPRTLERAWREGILSERVRDALEKQSIKRAWNDEFELVRRFEGMLDRLEAEESGQVNISPYIKVMRTGLAWVRWALARRYEVAVMAALVRAHAAANQEASCDAAE